MRLKLVCNSCDFTELVSDPRIDECPYCHSSKIELISIPETFPRSKVEKTSVVTEVIFGIIGVLLLFSGIFMLNSLSVVLGLTFVVIGIIILVVLLGSLTRGGCLYCCA